MQPNAPFMLGRVRLMGWGARGHAAVLLWALVFSLLVSPLLSLMHHRMHPGHGLAPMVAQSAN